MKKITQLYRLNFYNSILVLSYLIKRGLRLKVSKKEQFVNEYFFHLIRFNGFLKKEFDDSYIAYYKDLKLELKTRKRPSSDLNVFSQIFYQEEYKPVINEFLKSFTKKENLAIIDAGSNIGLTSVLFSKKFPNSKIIAVEPDSSNFDVMSYNLDSNLVNSSKFKNGIWSKDCYLDISKDFRDKNDWSIQVKETKEPSSLKAFSITGLMNKTNIDEIDILKIDIEGSEKEVFTSKESDVSFLSKTKCIAIEIHDEFDCREEIYEVLKKHQFDFFNEGELTIGINKNYLKV